MVTLITKQDIHFAGSWESYSEIIQTPEAVWMMKGLEHLTYEES